MSVYILYIPIYIIIYIYTVYNYIYIYIFFLMLNPLDLRSLLHTKVANDNNNNFFLPCFNILRLLLESLFIEWCYVELCS